MDQGKSSPRDKESAREDQTTEERQISQTVAVRKGNSKANLFWKKSKTDIRKSFDRSSSNENNETQIS